MFLLERTSGGTGFATIRVRGCHTPANWKRTQACFASFGSHIGSQSSYICACRWNSGAFTITFVRIGTRHCAGRKLECAPPHLAMTGVIWPLPCKQSLSWGMKLNSRDEVERAFPGASLIIDHDKGLFAVQLKMPGLNRPLDATELSDGTLRYLCLMAALMSPRPPTLLALNEPETSLHPDLLNGLARMIVRASKSSQLWITTHSSSLAESIERYSGEQSIKLELSNGETAVVGRRLVAAGWPRFR